MPERRYLDRRARHHGVSQLVFPSNAFSDADSGALEVMRTAGGNFLGLFFQAVFVPGALGAALTAQASVARVLYAMGRARAARSVLRPAVNELSVVKHYFVDERDRRGTAIIRNLVLPLIGFALTVWLWTNLSRPTLMIGLCWLATGMLWLVILTRGFRRPKPMIETRHPE